MLISYEKLNLKFYYATNNNNLFPQCTMMYDEIVFLLVIAIRIQFKQFKQ